MPISIAKPRLASRFPQYYKYLLHISKSRLASKASSPPPLQLTGFPPPNYPFSLYLCSFQYASSFSFSLPSPNPSLPLFLLLSRPGPGCWPCPVDFLAPLWTLPGASVCSLSYICNKTYSLIMPWSGHAVSFYRSYHMGFELLLVSRTRDLPVHKNVK